MSSLDHAALNVEQEGDRRSGQGGGRRALSFAHGDVPLCIQRSRNKDTIQQHDPSRNIDAHDERQLNPITSTTTTEGEGQQQSNKKKQKWKILRRRQQRSEKQGAAAQTQAAAKTQAAGSMNEKKRRHRTQKMKTMSHFRSDTKECEVAENK